MDIRNFFGGNKKGSNVTKESVSTELAELTSVETDVLAVDYTDNGNDNHNEPKVVSKRRRVIADEDDEFVAEDEIPKNEILKETVETEPVVASRVLETVNKKVEIVKVDPKMKISAEKSKDSKAIEKPVLKKDMEKVVETETAVDGGIPADLVDFISWKPGESIPYIALVNTFESISNVTGRLDKEKLFTRLFRAVIVTTPSELDSIVYLASNNVYPAYDGKELGIGDSLLVKAVCEATGRNKAAVDEAYQTQGDLGTVALMSRANQKTLSFAAKPKPLLAKNVLEQYRVITQTKGDKAQGRKVEIIKALMVKCQGSEAKYIVRALQGKLRIGTAEQTVLVALAHAFAQTPTAEVVEMIRVDKEKGLLTAEVLVAENEEENDADEEEGEKEKDEDDVITGDLVDETTPFVVEEDGQDLLQLLEKVKEKETPEARSLRSKTRITKEERYNLAEIAVKRAYSECPNLTLLVTALLTRPVYRLYEACRLTIGVPVAPMLAKPTKEINEVLKRLSGQPFTMEYKYDGERAQVHYCEDGSVRIFSRNSEDNTNKYPDLLEVMKRARKDEVVSCIIDAEVVAYDREKGVLLPFQVLSTRKRKVDEGEEDNQKVKIILQAFDLLYLNGKSLLRETLRTRRTIMHSSFQHSEGFFHFASGSDHVENGDTAPIEAFLQEACAAMCEGLMVKTLDDNASYEPSKRSLNWLKLKKDYIDGMGVCDSVDLVVLGGYYGRGKRTNTYGAYLMACYDPDRDEYQSVCKVGTGFKDEDLARLFEQMKTHVVPSKRKPINFNVGEPLYPDDWFEPNVVWELQAADLSKSSVHMGGVGRVGDMRGIGLRFPRYIRDRPDKNPENATSAEQIVDMYSSQGGVGGEEKADDDNDDDDEGI